MFNNIIRAVRQRVSADKRRFNMGEIDVDLTYITDRIIGKFFGSSGTDSIINTKINSNMNSNILSE